MNKKSFAISLIMILTGLGSFGLGRLSVVEKKYSQNKDIEIIVPKLNPLNNIDESDFDFMASKNGTKYYPVNCKSAERIKDENRVYFVTQEEAEQAGFEKSATCEFN